MYNPYLKRIFDILASGLLLVCFFPVGLLLTILLSFVNQGKPFFVQKRPGKNEKVFRLFKFRTMHQATDANGNLLPDRDRLTSIGRWIRKTSLDELPQLVNVLKGEMSFVGPRPLLIRYLPFYSEKEKRRHAVQPGITGLAQVSGRNHLGWDERLATDVKYVECISFALDCQILIKTIQNVLTAKDVAVDPNAIIIDLDEYRKN